jgi:hypothetical protein
VKIIWVSAESGNDTTGNGSYETPYLTIDKALQEFVSGDQIRLMDGTYTPTDSVIFSGVEGSLFSENPLGAYIQPQKTDSHASCVAVLSSPRFSIIGVNVLQAADSTGNLIGIYAEDVENFLCLTCAVSNFEVPSGDATGVFAAGDGRVENVDVKDFAGAGSIVYGIRTKGVDIIDCTNSNVSAVNDLCVYEHDGLKYG